MAALESVNAAGLVREHLESASPDLLRAMVKTFAEALIPFKGRWFLYYGTADSRVGVAVSGGKGEAGGGKRK